MLDKPMSDEPQLPPDACVALDTPCIGCGYNLKTLGLGGKCPECGVQVATSEGLARAFSGGRSWNLARCLHVMAWVAIAYWVLLFANMIGGGFTAMLRMALITVLGCEILLALVIRKVLQNQPNQFRKERRFMGLVLGLVGAVTVSLPPPIAYVVLLAAPGIFLCCLVAPSLYRMLSKVNYWRLGGYSRDAVNYAWVLVASLLVAVTTGSLMAHFPGSLDRSPIVDGILILALVLVITAMTLGNLVGLFLLFRSARLISTYAKTVAFAGNLRA